MGDSGSDANECFFVKMHVLMVVPVVSPGSKEKNLLEILLRTSPLWLQGGLRRRARNCIDGINTCVDLGK